MELPRLPQNLHFGYADGGGKKEERRNHFSATEKERKAKNGKDAMKRGKAGFSLKFLFDEERERLAAACRACIDELNLSFLSLKSGLAIPVIGSPLVGRVLVYENIIPTKASSEV